MPDDIKLPVLPPIHHKWAPLISDHLAEALQAWCRTYARAAILADRQQRAANAHTMQHNDGSWVYG
ncbi:hypothetical protein FOC84_22360 [Achromobacter pestifer]|uniref:Uncharacterized protein n=1 Tax=Achromobacter pestifer TaxID=1353889 RepID=A0A7D4DZP3_9BURK|nr:hypothetical protein [Achromobacter pestifer]QKH37525.1 hypothetical protein FOC84_22360 [Achromobacter pestifer]